MYLCICVYAVGEEEGGEGDEVMIVFLYIFFYNIYNIYFINNKNVYYYTYNP